jgi:hypothetical protein
VSREEVEDATNDAIRTQGPEDVMNGDDNAYVFLCDLASYLMTGADSVKQRADRLGVKFVMLRNPRANNHTARAVTAEEARRIILSHKENSGPDNARTLGPKELADMMEEKA